MRAAATAPEGAPPAAAGWYRPLPALGWEGVAAVAVLLLSATALFEYVLELPGGSLVMQGSWSLIYLAVGTLMIQRFGRQWIIWLLRNQPLLCALVAIALASCLWSADPAVSLRRAVSLAGTTLIGVFIGYAFPPRAIMRALFWTFAVLVVGSLVAGLAAPDLAASHRGWHGITTHKQALGFVAAFAALFFLIGTVGRRIAPVPGGILFALSVLALVLAYSAAGLIILGAGAIVVACFTAARRLRFPSLAVLLLLFIGLGLGAIVLTLALESFVETLGRDATLTQRTEIWADAVRVIAERPWTGFGYEAVWGRRDETWLPGVIGFRSDWAGHAHNGFLNVATELGLPAAVLAALYVFRTLLRAVDSFVRRPSPFALFAITFTFAILIGNIAEARFLGAQSHDWILFVAMAVAVVRSAEPGPPRTRTRGRQRRRPRRVRDGSGGRDVAEPDADGGEASPQAGVPAETQEGRASAAAPSQPRPA